MNKSKLYEQLEVPPGGTLILEQMQMVYWGRDLVFQCVYRPAESGEPLHFKLHFKDCLEMRWRVYSHLNPDIYTPSTVVDFALGKDNHRKPAHILTDFFGLTVTYGSVVIQTETK